MVNYRGYEFSLHSLDQMGLRIGSTLNNEGRSKIQKYLEEIDKYQAYLLIGDETLAGSFNRNTYYYRIDCRDTEVAELFIKYGAKPNLVNGHQFVLVVRDDLVITFKTTTDKAIYGNLKRLDKSYKREKTIPRCMDSHYYLTPEYLYFIVENKEHIVDHVKSFMDSYFEGRELWIDGECVYAGDELLGKVGSKKDKEELGGVAHEGRN